MSDERAPGAEAGGEVERQETGVVPGAAARSEMTAWRLISMLGGAGAVAGLTIVLVFGWASPRIEAHRAEVLRQAIHEVLRAPDRYATLFVLEGKLVSALPAGVDSAGLDRVYIGYDAAGERVGFAIAGQLPGYQEVIRLLFGYDAEDAELLGMKVLESKETPGLGDKIEKDSAFVFGFEGVVPPIEGVRRGSGTGDESEIDLITGATISSRTVIRIINRRLESLGAMIDVYVEESREGGG